MRAVVVTRAGELALDEVPDPVARPGWVTIRVAACGICGSDLHFLGSPIATPGLVMGHEFSGIVEAIGEGVSNLAPGDRVAVLPAERCAGAGACPACDAGFSQRCFRQAPSSIGITIPGAFAEIVEVPATSCFGVAETASLELCALVEPLAVAIHAIGLSQYSTGMSVGIVGAGPIGLLVMLALRNSANCRIGIAEPNSSRRDAAFTLGADAVTTSAGAIPAALGETPELVFECAGSRSTPGEAIGMVRSGGEVILVGVTDPTEMLQISSIVWVVKEATVRGAIAYTNDEFREAADLIARPDIPFGELITSVRPLAETPLAFDELLTPNDQLKVLIDPSS